ncbi:hypothetical protein vseg_010775 [Gypsophila vaccaria]
MSTVQFNGTGDPEEHLATFESHMYIYEADDAAWCKVFPTTLTGLAQTWFRGQPTGSISSYRSLVGNFPNNTRVTAGKRSQ